MITAKDPLMTVKGVSQRLGMSLSFVYQELSAKRMECYQLGRVKGSIRISEEQFSRYLESFSKGKNKATIKPPEVIAPPTFSQVSKDLNSFFKKNSRKKSSRNAA